jgi:phosphoglycerate dehydrogenase-like enzyme
VKGVFLADKTSPFFDTKTFYNIFSDYNMEVLLEIIDISPMIVDRNRLEENASLLCDADFIFSTWGLGFLSQQEILRYFPRLQAVFYAAGSVRHFVRPFFNCGIRIFSARTAHAVPVAEYTLAQILLAGKGVQRLNAQYKQQGYEAAKAFAGKFDGNYYGRIGILGAGNVGTKLIELLKPFSMDILVYDPFLTPERAEELGVHKASLDILFSTCNVITNHMASNDRTRNSIHYDRLCQMQDYTTLINTAQGDQINMEDLIRFLSANKTITAILDVTEPEPLSPGHPLLAMDNVILTPRIAGSMGNELARMGEYMVRECKAYVHHEPLKYEITEDMLDIIA